jgi:hypothetical protein
MLNGKNLTSADNAQIDANMSVVRNLVFTPVQLAMVA